MCYVAVSRPCDSRSQPTVQCVNLYDKSVRSCTLIAHRKACVAASGPCDSRGGRNTVEHGAACLYQSSGRMANSSFSAHNAAPNGCKAVEPEILDRIARRNVARCTATFDRVTVGETNGLSLLHPHTTCLSSAFLLHIMLFTIQTRGCFDELNSCVATIRKAKRVSCVVCLQVVERLLILRSERHGTHGKMDSRSQSRRWG
jgi:hypothetical protein